MLVYQRVLRMICNSPSHDGSFKNHEVLPWETLGYLIGEAMCRWRPGDRNDEETGYESIIHITVIFCTIIYYMIVIYLLYIQIHINYIHMHIYIHRYIHTYYALYVWGCWDVYSLLIFGYSACLVPHISSWRTHLCLKGLALTSCEFQVWWPSDRQLRQARDVVAMFGTNRRHSLTILDLFKQSTWTWQACAYNLFGRVHGWLSFRGALSSTLLWECLHVNSTLFFLAFIVLLIERALESSVHTSLRSKDENVKFYFSRSGFDYDCPLQDGRAAERCLTFHALGAMHHWRLGPGRRFLLPAGDSNASHQSASFPWPYPSCRSCALLAGSIA